MDLWLSSLKSMALQLLVAEIDSVFLELGFVGYKTRSETEKSPDCPDSDHNSTRSVFYTLPALVIDNDDQTEKKAPPLVQVKFQPLGNFLVICGSLDRGGWGLRKLCFNKTGAFASAIKRGDVMGFRRRIKDGLCFPLLIHITEEAGLPGPNCFSTLPGELKLGIMTLLPAKAMARMECVCSSLRSMSSFSNQLWEDKYYEVFGKVLVAGAESSSSVDWRKLFLGRAGKRKLSGKDAITTGAQAKRLRLIRDLYTRQMRERAHW